MRLPLARLEAPAVAKLTEEDLEEARRMDCDMAEALADFGPLRFSQLNKAFHTAICRRAGDAHLIAMLDTEWARLGADAAVGLHPRPAGPCLV